MASSRVSLKNGLKTKILFRKSIASGVAAEYFEVKSHRFMNEYDFKYSIAFWSVTNDISSSFGVPITLKMTASWSLVEKGKPFLYSVVSFAGDKGKQDFPGKRGFLSMKVGALDFIILSNSAKMQPIDQTSIAGP